MIVRQPAQPCCDRCRTTRGRLHEVEIENPDGRVTVCDDCEDELIGDVVREVSVHA